MPWALGKRNSDTHPLKPTGHNTTYCGWLRNPFRTTVQEPWFRIRLFCFSSSIFCCCLPRFLFRFVFICLCFPFPFSFSLCLSLSLSLSLSVPLSSYCMFFLLFLFLCIFLLCLLMSLPLSLSVLSCLLLLLLLVLLFLLFLLEWNTGCQKRQKRNRDRSSPNFLCKAPNFPELGLPLPSQDQGGRAPRQVEGRLHQFSKLIFSPPPRAPGSLGPVLLAPLPVLGPYLLSSRMSCCLHTSLTINLVLLLRPELV